MTDGDDEEKKKKNEMFIIYGHFTIL